MYPASTSPPIPLTQPEIRADFAVPGTFFPHILIDEVLPIISGSEWQLLTIVVRATLGWHDPLTRRRKSSDWLSHRQLKARTGRGSEAVSHAVDGLVRKDLIEVRDEQGRLMATADERRRSCSRLFYSLSPQLLARFQNPRSSERTAATVPVSPTDKAETTKETGTKFIQGAFAKDKTAAADQGPLLSSPTHPEDESALALTSPATPNPPHPSTQLQASASDVHSAHYLPFVRRYHEKLGTCHLQGNSQEETTSLSTEEQTQLEVTLALYGLESMEQFRDTFLENPSALLHRHGYSLAAFLKVLPILAVLRNHSGASVRPSYPYQARNARRQA